MTPLRKLSSRYIRPSMPSSKTSSIPNPPPPYSQTRSFSKTRTVNMRLEYAPKEAAADAPETTKAIYKRIAERRAPRPLLPLDLALLHNPAIADGWNSLLGAVRTKTSLNPGLMEMAVSRIAKINKATFEWNSHAPLALKGGLSRESLDVIRTAELVPKGGRAKTEVEAKTLKEEEWAVMCFTDQVTKEVEADEEVFDALRNFLDEKGIMEMTATVATYNMVSRFLVALNVAEKNGVEIEMPEE